MNGILPLWKPKGMTSHDCVMRIRKLLHIKKVGHTGTLDPEVEGVLPVCIGQATKIVPFLSDITKTYIAEIKLGAATDTEDSHGKVTEVKSVTPPLSQQAIENVLQSFKGEITQIPPMYSAVKIKGKKLYEYARANEQVERPKRQVTIFDLELGEGGIQEDSFWVRAVCSKGTYIRTLCVDIGADLGYPAHMGTLYRIESGAINQKDTVTFQDVEQAIENGTLDWILLPINRGLEHMERLFVDADTKKRILNGQKLSKPSIAPETDPFLIMYDDQVLAVYQTHPKDADVMKPVRVFND
ncbi:tRNA pseudouridine(55) synthase TruB [Lentibacillus cibarius]|uniref:tRNA pseudouridine synthase B n=1 Tax=Lentibacillus cibarius TaxID=2583219 RepID=A0A5S3QPB8_9BACI|nr:tRNA pseudouridine(55) synthase TruB [Lentibacillus cibarius]TMN23615.1 tRNA pseudouridine(55) synthase TruB [Lentibacillus cibarius]